MFSPIRKVLLPFSLAGDKKTSAREGLSWVLPERIGKINVNAKIQQAELLRWLEDPEKK